MSVPATIASFLASLPESERARFAAFHELLLVEVSEQVDLHVEDAVESAVESAVEDEIAKAIEKGLEEAMDDLDIAQEASDAIGEAVEDYDFDDQIEDATEKGMRDLDIGEYVNNAIEEAGLDDLQELCSDVLDAATAAKEQAEILAKRMADISSGGFLRRLRWLLTGK